MTVTNCRPFRKFVNSSSLKNATVFLQGAGNEGDEAQLSTIHRCAYCHAINGFKPISLDVMPGMYKMAQLAIKKRENFLSSINEEEWLVETMAVCENKLRITIFEKELTENAGNDHNVLRYLLDTFKRHFP